MNVFGAWGEGGAADSVTALQRDSGVSLSARGRDRDRDRGGLDLLID